jgi:hypothetical protein
MDQIKPFPGWIKIRRRRGHAFTDDPWEPNGHAITRTLAFSQFVNGIQNGLRGRRLWSFDPPTLGDGMTCIV